MAVRRRALPFAVIVTGFAALAMIVPVIFAAVERDWLSMRAFVTASLLTGVIFGLVAIVTAVHSVKRPGRSYLLSMVATFAVLPFFLALPVYEAMPGIGFLDAYLEMVSAITTTGLVIFPADGVPATVHLWRALVGWLGGLFMWIAAIAILAPLNLGGFEVLSTAEIGQGASATTAMTRSIEPGERLWRYAGALAPIYFGLTLVLWVLLMSAGSGAFEAACFAMSTLSTSGITPLSVPGVGGAGTMGEVAIFLFFIFAISRRTVIAEDLADYATNLGRDPEIRLAAAIVVIVPLVLFLRHWIGAIEFDAQEDLLAAIRALWGAIFTVMSFLTTTGFESMHWEASRTWSGLSTPGLILMGLALMGGGVATTAGGVKLLRIYALYKNGARELDRLVHPSSVGGSGPLQRRIRRQGAYVAWIFFMLFALALAVVMMGLAMAGVPFDLALVLSAATLSTTGPVASAALDAPVVAADLGGAAEAVLAAAMVLGRLETLALIALFNPDFWRA